MHFVRSRLRFKREDTGDSFGFTVLIRVRKTWEIITSDLM